MNKTNDEELLDPRSDKRWILASLEHDQLVKAKKHNIPLRVLKGPELLILWALRGYLLFMMTVVVYQLWSGTQ